MTDLSTAAQGKDGRRALEILRDDVVRDLESGVLTPNEATAARRQLITIMERLGQLPAATKPATSSATKFGYEQADQGAEDETNVIDEVAKARDRRRQQAAGD